MTYLEAALQVLKASNQPLSTGELLDRMIRYKLVEVSGSTPQATLSASLYRALGREAHLERVSEPGSGRARRGSVHWAYVR